MDDASYTYLIKDRISIIQGLICNSIGTEMHRTYKQTKLALNYLSE